MKKLDFIKLGLILVLLVAIIYVFKKNQELAKGGSIKLYWLVVEGMRADPELFQIFEWAQQGELPQIKKLMTEGAYGYARSEESPRLPDFIKQTRDHKLALISVSEGLTQGIQPDFVITNSWGSSQARPDAFSFQSSAREWRAEEYKFPVKTFSKRRDIEIESKGIKVFASSVDLSNDQEQNYDSLSLSRDGRKIDVTLKPGETSVWFPVAYEWNGKVLHSNLQYQLITVEDDGHFKLKIHLDGLNENSVRPARWVGEIRKNVGPMIDAIEDEEAMQFDDEKDRQALLFEMKSSLDWHEAFIPYLAKVIAPEMVIHKLYHPRQFFTSHRWLGSLHPQGSLYANTSEEEKAKRKNEVLGLYKRVDQLLGRIMISSAKDAVIVLSATSVPTVVSRVFHISSYISQKGWEQVSFDPSAGVRFQDDSSDRLIAEVKASLEGLKDEQAVHMFNKVELVESPTGKLLELEVRKGLLLTERPALSEELIVPTRVSGSGQLTFLNESDLPLMPFLIAGPGVKKSHSIEGVLSFEDQEAFVLKALHGELLKNAAGNSMNPGPRSSGQ